jgi:poly-gamma-glutamate capsule biosynthesis protein CapA/YwtB (metallophosphatase superfamily)
LCRLIDKMASKLLKVIAVGDVMLGRLVDQLFQVHNFDPECFSAKYFLKLLKKPYVTHDYVWGDLLPTFRQADLRLINLETSVTTSDKMWPNKMFHYRMHPENVKALKEAKIDYCSLANNHTLDFHVEGMFETMKTLTSHQIAWAGVGSNCTEAMKPTILNFCGKKMACFSLADHPEEWEATDTSPGINFFDVGQWTKKERYLERLKRAISQCRELEKPDLITVSIHWGPNYQWEPSKEFQSFAHHLVDEMGVDLLHGHSSHHVQGVEIYKKKFILYGCGDFIDDYAVDSDYRNDLGFCYQLYLDPTTNEFRKMKLIPVKINFMQVNKVQDNAEKKWLFDTMKRLCHDFGTKVDEKEETLEIHNNA